MQFSNKHRCNAMNLHRGRYNFSTSCVRWETSYISGIQALSYQSKVVWYKSSIHMEKFPQLNISCAIFHLDILTFIRIFNKRFAVPTSVYYEDIIPEQRKFHRIFHLFVWHVMGRPPANHMAEHYLNHWQSGCSQIC